MAKPEIRKSTQQEDFEMGIKDLCMRIGDATGDLHCIGCGRRIGKEFRETEMRIPSCGKCRKKYLFLTEVEYA